MKKLIFALIVAAFVAGGFSDGAHAHWGGSGERQVVLYDHTRTSSWDIALRRAVDAWNVSPYINISVIEAEPGVCGYAAGGIGFCSEWTSEWWGGWASQQFGPDGHFSATLAWINERIVPGTDPYVGTQQAYACHEIGHDLGIVEHARKRDNSCMMDGPYLGAPGSWGLNRLAQIYAHGH